MISTDERISHLRYQALDHLSDARLIMDVLQSGLDDASRELWSNTTRMRLRRHVQELCSKAADALDEAEKLDNT